MTARDGRDPDEEARRTTRWPPSGRYGPAWGCVAAVAHRGGDVRDLGTVRQGARSPTRAGAAGPAVPAARSGSPRLVLAVPAVLQRAGGRWPTMRAHGPQAWRRSLTAVSAFGLDRGRAAARWPTSTPWAALRRSRPACWSTPGPSSSCSGCGCATRRAPQPADPGRGRSWRWPGWPSYWTSPVRPQPDLVGVMWGLLAAVGAGRLLRGLVRTAAAALPPVALGGLRHGRRCARSRRLRRGRDRPARVPHDGRRRRRDDAALVGGGRCSSPSVAAAFAYLLGTYAVRRAGRHRGVVRGAERGALRHRSSRGCCSASCRGWSNWPAARWSSPVWCAFGWVSSVRDGPARGRPSRRPARPRGPSALRPSTIAAVPHSRVRR